MEDKVTTKKKKSKPVLFVVPTMAAVSEFFGVIERTVRNWKKESMPVETSGNYDLSKIARWLFIRKGPSEETARRIQTLEEDILRHKARKLGMEADYMSAKLIDKDNVYRVWGQYIASWAAQIQAWPDSVLTEVPLESRAGTEKILRHLVDDLGKQLAANTAMKKIDKKGKSLASLDK